MSNPYGNGLLLLDGDIIGTSNGDFYTIADYEKKNSDDLPFEGYYNILISLTNRLLTQKGDNVFHPEYGSDIPSMLSQPNSANFASKIKNETEETLLQDARVDLVEEVKIEQNGKIVTISAKVKLVGKNQIIPFLFPSFVTE